MSEIQLFLYSVLFMLSGPIMVSVMMLVLYLSTLLVFTRMQGKPKDEVAGQAMLTAGAFGWALITLLAMGPNGSVSLGMPGVVLAIVAVTAIVWIPVGDLIWRDAGMNGARSGCPLQCSDARVTP